MIPRVPALNGVDGTIRTEGLASSEVDSTSPVSLSPTPVPQTSSLVRAANCVNEKKRLLIASASSNYRTVTYSIQFISGIAAPDRKITQAIRKGKILKNLKMHHDMQHAIY